jgi:hypothetical protein
VQEGQVSVSDDLAAVEARWFDGAAILNRAERPGSRPYMMFVRCSQRTVTPLEALLYSRPVDVIASPLFRPEELRCVFPCWTAFLLLNALLLSPDPMAAHAEPAPALPPVSGLPGRPTAKHLYVKEAERRIENSAYPETLTAFAQELADWLGDTHPNVPRGGAKAIENAIRGLWQSRPKTNP